MLPEYRITAGFVPLTDSMLLIVAKEKGFAGSEGVDLTLIKESSWANIRDRVAIGHFDVAHMLAPMPIAATLGLTPLAVPVIAPMALVLGGNAVTVSTALWAKMKAAGAPDTLAAGPVGKALASVVEGTERKLRFAVVHPHSGHNYELRYWLAASGIDPDRKVEIVVLPPPLMPDALATGGIDGFCVGEPWNSIAIAAGRGRIATVKAAIWPRSPEKVLGVTEAWAVYNPDALSALLRALYLAAEWCGQPANHAEAAGLLAQSAYLDAPAELLRTALSGKLDLGGGQTEQIAEFFIPHAHAATFPAAWQALWFYSQMVRWGDVAHTPENASLAHGTFRPDLYRKALGGIAPALPTLDKPGIQTGPFFDGIAFDSQNLDHYIASQRPYA
ncbi:MAG: CmpA/NrtA family ABC transporter substrate-binding protein [Devosia sp.]